MRLSDAPTSVIVLARVLGYDAQALAGLQETHGERLLAKLQREWWGNQDRPRLLHRDSSHGYTESSSQALPVEPEAVPAKYQDHLATEGRKRTLTSQTDEDRKRLERLRRCQQQARKHGLDFDHHVMALEARIRMFEVELDRAA
jgi:hypothetical protein